MFFPISSTGWPNSGSHYPGQQQRGYPVPPQGQGSSSHPLPPQGSTPAPAQSPGATAPQQAISPTPWGASASSGPPGRSGAGSHSSPPNSNAQQGPPPPPPGATWPQQDPRYGSTPGSSIMSPPGPGSSSSHSHSQQQPPWTPPGPGSASQSQSRSGSGGRSLFPSGGKPTGPPEMFRGYGSSPSSIQPPSGPLKGPHPSHMGPSLGMMSPQQQQQGPHHPGSFSQGPGQLPQSGGVQVKREVIFPPESVEAVTPVLSRRRKMHKSDVSPVEAWRIMMSLKSGLLAEVTWALDVLNVLLYDDQSVSYFSLTYLPGLLDILLEHLRRALILLFGQSIGIDLSAGDKLEDAIKPAVSL